ncbi:AAA family ATPase [Belliella marina]|uniref:AAA family ATPase n=1 Tax=Belliella marina TaxID=1644146 RepID=A0ABW4VK24_9BACT
MEVKKVVIIGPESTGKSTLSKALAATFGEHWVYEYARQYLNDLGRTYQYEDLLEIAKKQIGLEDKKLKKSKNILFIDTDLNVIKVWSDHKFGKTDPWILEQIKKRKYDLYLLTDIDIPWEDDPQREHPNPEMRSHFFNIYKDLLQASGIPFEIISGGYDERFVSAMKALKKHGIY